MFCKKDAWHEDLHEFECGHMNKASFEKLDLVICMDVTGSMSKYLKMASKTITELVKNIQRGYKKEKSILFGYVAYRDHHDEYKSFLVKHQDLTTSSNIINYIDTELSCGGGGGDGAEAVMDGLYSAIHDISWRQDSARYIFHVCDGPPHGSEYGPKRFDHYSDGCPCGITLEDVASDLKKNQISYKLLKIGSYINKMARIFEDSITDFEKKEIGDAQELVDTVSDVILRDLRSEELDILLPK